MSSVTPSSVDDAPAAARLERPPKEAAGEERWLPRTNANGALQSAAASLHIATGLELRGMAVAVARRTCRAWPPARRPVAILNRIHWSRMRWSRDPRTFVVASGGRAVAETLTRGVFFL